MSTAATLPLIACGSSTTSSPPSTSDPGSGSKTLYVGVELTLSSIGANTPVPSLSVVIAQASRDGASVSGAAVKLTAGDGVTVTPTESATVPGYYEASGFTWEPTWHVEISSGLDHLEATVAALGRTTITAPAQNATVPAGQVAIQWTDAWGEKAQSTWVSPCCGQSVVDLTDTGSGLAPAIVPGGVYMLYRQDVTPLAGGVANAFASSTTSNGLYLNVQ
jgi:hypothetical protein